MSKAEIDAINKYCSPESLLIINFKGELIRLNCPFDVIVIAKIDIYAPGDKLKVQQVKMDINFILVYIIRGKCYYYFNFLILIG